jgi:hypothetical protein
MQRIVIIIMPSKNLLRNIYIKKTKYLLKNDVIEMTKYQTLPAVSM